MIITVGGVPWCITCGTKSKVRTNADLLRYYTWLVSGVTFSLTPVCIGQLCDSRDYGRYYLELCCSGIWDSNRHTHCGAILGTKAPRDGWAWSFFSSLSYVVSVCCFIAARVLAVGWSLSVVTRHYCNGRLWWPWQSNYPEWLSVPHGALWRSSGKGNFMERRWFAIISIASSWATMH